MKDIFGYCKCTDCPVLKKLFLNWTIKDQFYVEDIVKKSGISYSEFMHWLFSVIERVKNE